MRSGQRTVTPPRPSASGEVHLHATAPSWAGRHLQATLCHCGDGDVCSSHTRGRCSVSRAACGLGAGDTASCIPRAQMPRHVPCFTPFAPCVPSGLSVPGLAPQQTFCPFPALIPGGRHLCFAHGPGEFCPGWLGAGRTVPSKPTGPHGDSAPKALDGSQRQHPVPRLGHAASTCPPCFPSRCTAHPRRTCDALRGTLRAGGGSSTPGSAPSHSDAGMTSTRVPAPGVISGRLGADSASTHMLFLLSLPSLPLPRAAEGKRT